MGHDALSRTVAFRSIDVSLLDIQLYLAVTAVSSLAVAALAGEREVLVDRLRASRTRIVVAADEERRRLERNLHDGAQQRLVALAARLGMAARNGDGATSPTAASLDAAQTEVLAALEDLRELVHGIRPARAATVRSGASGGRGGRAIEHAGRARRAA